MVHLVLEQCAIVVSAFPNDLKLPGLQHLTDTGERKQLLSELLPDQPNLWQGNLRCLRYRPERRYVAELHAADQTRALLKSYTRKGYARGKRNAAAFQSSGPLRIARLLGCLDSRCLLAFEWLPGPLLFDLCLESQTDCPAVITTGAALALRGRRSHYRAALALRGGARTTGGGARTTGAGAPRSAPGAT